MSKRTPTVLHPELEEAFSYLKTYDLGSGRGGLVRIDQAVHECCRNGKAKELENRLIAVLESGVPAPAREYICSKLALMGTETSVGALKKLLGNAESTTAACDALEKIPGRAASKALGSALGRLEGRFKAALLRSLGVRREARSVSEIGRCLKDPDETVSMRAAEALGEIGTERCARLLQEECASDSRRWMFDALLACAERLKEDGREAEAARIYRFVSSTTMLPYIKRAADQELRG